MTDYKFGPFGNALSGMFDFGFAPIVSKAATIAAGLGLWTGGSSMNVGMVRRILIAVDAVKTVVDALPGISDVIDAIEEFVDDIPGLTAGITAAVTSWITTNLVSTLQTGLTKIVFNDIAETIQTGFLDDVKTNLNYLSAAMRNDLE